MIFGPEPFGEEEMGLWPFHSPSFVKLAILKPVADRGAVYLGTPKEIKIIVWVSNAEMKQIDGNAQI